MSVYNDEKYLSECIESVLNQSFRDFEFLIVDDLSTDNSREIIKEYQKVDERILLIENTVNLGLTMNLNKLIKISKGKYIARFDSDDICFSERLKKQYTFLENNEDVFLLGSGAEIIDEYGNHKSNFAPICDTGKIKKSLLINNCIYHSSIMFRNEGFFYREKFIYAQDYDFYLYLLSKGKNLANVSEKLIKYRINSSSISWSKSAKQGLFAEKAREFYLGRINNGKDGYDAFENTEILSINIETSNNIIILRCEIEANFKLNNFIKTRMLCKRLFQHHGYINKYLIYYLLSFTSKSFVDFLRRIMF